MLPFLYLDNNAYSGMLKGISNIVFGQLANLSLFNDNIQSIEVLSRFSLSNLKNLYLSIYELNPA